MQGFFRYPAALVCCGLILGTLLIGYVYNVSGLSGSPELTGNWSSFSWTTDGKSVKGNLAVKNIGTSDAGAFDVSFYLSNDGSSLIQPPLSQSKISKLKAGQLKQISFKYKSSVSLSVKSIIAFIDSGNKISEPDKSNNLVGVLISAQDIPVANAGSGQTVTVKQKVYLDGGRSTDPDGRPLAYKWSFDSVPKKSHAKLSQPTSAMPTFTPDLAGAYVVNLTVNNGVYNSSVASKVTITTGNTAPVANAGPDQAVQAGQTVTLDGSKSSDVNGDRLTYKWSLVSPEGSLAALSDAKTVTPSFTVDLPGAYVAQLIVKDATLESAPDTVTVTTGNIAPVANAGPDQAVQAGQKVTLDGSRSTYDSAPLTCHWSLLSVPSGSSAIISNPGTASPNFTIDKKGIYIAQLYVDDGYSDSFPDTVVISTSGTRPVAHVGAVQTLNLGQGAVTLDGSGSNDADGKPLTYKWSILCAPSGSSAALSSATTVKPAFTPDLAGQYVFQLSVSNGTYAGSPDTVLVTVLPPLTTVPNVVGMSTTQAASTIIAANLVIGTTSQQYSTTVSTGCVISQSPVAGSSITEGTQVNLVVSLGPPPVTVPNVVGMTQSAATSAITAVGLIVGTVTSQSSNTVSSGNVISESPVAGTSIPQASAVNLVVSTGPAMVAVPNVVGMAQSDAASAITAAGLTVGTVTTQTSSTIAAGEVISENPAAGASVAQGSAVDLVVSLGSGLPPDPGTVAPPVDQTVTTTIGSATSFLYTGTNPIQAGVTAGTIQPQRAAVIRGKVLDGTGAALPGVTIAILSHPEFGTTLSRADGMFDMAVNGGGPLTVNYQKTGYLPAHRMVAVPWQDYAFAPDVVLVQFDSKVSAIDLTATTPIQVAQGNPVTDTSGTRTATLLVPQGTTATMVLPDGTTQPLSSLHIRATEYTVGPDGPRAMPAVLPPTSGYTYCVELSADEAIAAGAQTVQFNRPVIQYLDNFLGFPTGLNVPVGYYDRTKGQWIPSPDGLVIKLLSVTNAMADLDVDGSGKAAGSAALSSLGITDAERAQLAGLYTAGQSFWRVLIPHFTSFDFNFPYGLPPDAQAPNQTAPTVNNLLDDPNQQCGSIIGCESQTLGEEIAITGTGFKLHYQNDRVRGHSIDRTIEIPLTGSSPPASLKRVDLLITVAGRMFNSSFAATPNQTTVFTWDGNDAYGRVLQGRQNVTIKIGYVYVAIYTRTNSGAAASFASVADLPITSTNGIDPHIHARTELTIWQTWQTAIGNNWNAQSVGLGGWTLGVHHAYSVAEKKLILGTGQQRSASAIDYANTTITTVAGNGSSGYSGDGGPATQAKLTSVFGLAAGPDGSLYIADTGSNRIRKVDPKGIITTVAGNGPAGYSGDGGPATQAGLNNPWGVAVGPDGSVYIADTGSNRIRKVDSKGIITTVAGNGSSGYSGDGGPATQTSLYYPSGVAVGPDGSIYVADTYNQRIRRVGTDGIISTVAGGSSGGRGDGGPAIQATLSVPFKVALGPDGSLYIVTGYTIRKVDPQGIITTVAGQPNSSGYSGDGGPATQALLWAVFSVGVGPDGSFYIPDYGSKRIRRVETGGVITTVAGNGSAGYSGDGGPATRASLDVPTDVAVGPDGSIYISDQMVYRVRRIAPDLPGYTIDDFLVPAEDGSEIYHFDGDGKHLTTMQPLTGAILYQFSYDSSGRLSAVTDGNGNTVTISHDVNSNPTAVTAPFGQKTVLTTDANGYLSNITNPAGNSYEYTYTADGLMTSMTSPNAKTFQFIYDGYGRLTKDSDPAGGSKNLARTDNTTGYSIALTTGLNRISSYSVQKLSTGGLDRVSVSPDGTKTEVIYGTDGSQKGTYPDGSTANLLKGPDPRFGMLAPLPTSMTSTTPGGLSLNTAMSRTATLSDPNNPLSLTGQIDTVSVNGRNYKSVFSASTRATTVTSPAGRQAVSTIDALGRITSSQISGLAPASYTYDSHGRPSTITGGTGTDVRTISLAYDTNGYLASITDPLNQSVQFQYDAAGRVTSRILLDGNAMGFQYDSDGNLTSITPPGRPAHTFTYTSVDQGSTYTAPGGDVTGYSYNIDRQLAQITRPDGETLNFAYDSAGRLSTLTIPSGQITYGYDSNTGNLNQIATSDGITTAIAYDGSLLKTRTWSGEISGQVGYTYDNDFRVTSINVNGSNPIPFQYDADSLLTQAGNLSLTRNSQNGLLTGTAIGNVTDGLTYNSFGETVSYTAAYSGTAVLSNQYKRDQLGRV